MRTPLRALAILGPALLLGCANAGEDRLLTVGSPGVVIGVVAFDANGSRTLDLGDDSMPGVRVRLLALAASDTIASAVAGADGSYRMAGVPTGKFRVVVDTAPFAATVMDTVVIARLDSATVTIPPSDSVVVNVLIGYPHVTVRAARTTVPLGRKVWVEGIGLNSAATFRDTTLHVQDTSVAIRATRVRPPPTAPGDSLRARGTTSLRNGQRTLDDVTVLAIAASFLPAATSLNTASAASAASGTRDAELIQVDSATVSVVDTVPPGDVRMMVNDGSGSLEVLLDATAVPANPVYAAGNAFRIVGVLVPTAAAGVWRLKPRSFQDLVKLNP
jgi:hypothetical protein